jgi:hypothetical protein
MAGYLLLGLGFAFVNPPITTIAVSGMPRAQAGVASAVATSSRQFGNVLGVAIVATTGKWDLAAACGLAIAALGYLCTGTRPGPGRGADSVAGRPVRMGARRFGGD